MANGQGGTAVEEIFEGAAIARLERELLHGAPAFIAEDVENEDVARVGKGLYGPVLVPQRARPGSFGGAGLRVVGGGGFVSSGRQVLRIPVPEGVRGSAYGPEFESE